MNLPTLAILGLSASLLLAPSLRAAAPAPDPAMMAAERQAMQALAMMDGVWRGQSMALQPDGTMLTMTQTERVGSMLSGGIKVIEGRGYGADGQLRFNAFGVVAFSPQTRQYSFRSYALGHFGDHEFEARPDGYVWTLKSGPATVRYTAIIKGDSWYEVGEMTMPGRPAVRVLEMTLKRVGDSDWPAGGAATMK